MAVRLWVLESEMDRITKYPALSELNFKEYGNIGENNIVTAETENTGVFSHLSREFVLGKINYWEQKGSEKRKPFIRINNHCAWPDGAIMTPNDWITTRITAGRRTIDEKTSLHRIQMLNAEGGDFIKRAFTTYDCQAIVPHPREKERHFLVYCDSRHLYKGRVK